MNKVPANDHKILWYIVQVQANCERIAGEDLIGMGFTVFVPQYRKEYRHHRTKRFETKYFPLMRGYLFVMASPHWSRIRQCKQVVAVLSSSAFGGDGNPIQIADKDVQAIRAAQDAGLFDQMKVHGGDVKAGDMVRIADGAFSGIQAVVEEAGETALTVLLSMLGQQVKTHVPLEKLEKAG